LLRTVGSELTALVIISACCVALAASITVIIASQFGLPVSSTHTAVGAIFGVGFLREYLKNGHAQRLELIKEHLADKPLDKIKAIQLEFMEASIQRKKQMLKDLRVEKTVSKKERKNLKKLYRHELVKRSHLYKIATAWIITVPLSGLLAAFFYYTIRGMLLP
jgi:PiT family inorganic phosphate transporter